MKKLSLDDLKVDSFATTALPSGRGTVMGHATEAATCPATCGVNGNSCGLQCATVAPMESCGAPYCGDSHAVQGCPGTTTIGGTTEGTLCGGTDEGTNCCGPYGPSYDYTFCQSMCC